MIGFGLELCGRLILGGTEYLDSSAVPIEFIIVRELFDLCGHGLTECGHVLPGYVSGRTVQVWLLSVFFDLALEPVDLLEHLLVLLLLDHLPALVLVILDLFPELLLLPIELVLHILGPGDGLV